MRKSRSDTAQTRQRIVSAAAKLFLDQGLAAVGTREVMAAASLTHGGFYRHFGSKEQLIAEANGAAFDHLVEMLASESAGKPPVEAIERIVSIYLGQSQSSNQVHLCPLAMLGAELSHSDPEVRAVAIDGYRRLVRLMADRMSWLSQAQALDRASGIFSAMVGAVTLANIAPDRQTADRILNNAYALIRTQLGAQEERS